MGGPFDLLEDCPSLQEVLVGGCDHGRYTCCGLGGTGGDAAGPSGECQAFVDLRGVFRQGGGGLSGEDVQMILGYRAG